MDRKFKTLCRSLGEQVRHLRREKGISQEELAFRADIDRTYISQIERGVSNPSLLVLYKVASVIGLSVPELFEPLNK